jgi:hypothetical protein
MSSSKSTGSEDPYCCQSNCQYICFMGSHVLFELPEAVTRYILVDWLGFKQVLRLDSSLNNVKLRAKFLTVTNGTVFSASELNLHRLRTRLTSVLHWAISRKSHLDGICIDEDFICTDNLLSAFLANSGFALRWVRSSSRSSTVNKETLLEISRRCPNVERLVLRNTGGQGELDDPLVELASAFQKLTVLGLFDIPLTERGLVALDRCRNLEALEYRTARLVPADFRETALTTLKSIKIYSKYISDDVLIAVGQRCPKLRTLFIFESLLNGESRVSDAGVLAVLQGCPLLRTTDVEYAASISHKLRVELARRCNFTQIDWSTWHSISDELAQKVLEVSPTVIEVDFRYCAWVTDATLAVCAERCPQLEVAMFAACPLVTSSGVRAFVWGLKRLRTLVFTGCAQLNEEVVLAIAEHCPLLERFHGPAGISSSVMAKLIERCRNLRL